MNDILLVILLNGFFLYLSYGYYGLYWEKGKRLHAVYVAGWAVAFFLLNLAYWGVSQGKDEFQVFVTVCIVLLFVAAAALLQFRTRLQEKEEERMEGLKQLQSEYYAKQYQTIARNQEEIRRQRHELKNCYILLYSMAKKQDCEGIISYLSELSGKLQARSDVRTGNLVVDAVLNDKMQKAALPGLKFDIDLNIPTKLDCSDVILCGVLGNALENAIEGCRRVPEKERRISVNMRIDKKSLFIEIRNAFDGFVRLDKKGNIMTRKPHKEEHGLGLQVMKELVEKHNGTLDVHWEDREFCLRVIFYQVI
ncbi:sensor histidine kinase [Cuneatibacter caecimuris]|uniref:GHKL domain-containing protein n=1 Tax=Cuneatibacter caecimuris TaxID=1796618 RepID=A0A4Q7P0H2_9FIRM|nr:ATP-binding protein [Cuneatibacter caecimuris]RZS92768.1 GHKL domain-containing protein [Cuneatibacter caecimuris]